MLLLFATVSLLTYSLLFVNHDFSLLDLSPSSEVIPQSLLKKYIKKNQSLLRTNAFMPSHLKGKKLAFHQIYESRKVGVFTLEKNGNVREGSSIKTILLWTTWNGLWDTINYYFLERGNISFVRYGCPYKRCMVTRDRNQLDTADAVLFHLLDIKLNDLSRKRRWDQLWIVYIMEAPWLVVYRSHLHQLPNEMFNLTMSYREDLSVLVRYGFINKNEKLENRIIEWNLVYRNKRGSVVWFVSDCNTDSKREKYVEELKKYIDVDIYGLCGDKKCFPSQSATCYDDIINQYKFYLSFENSICNDYVTEKCFNVFNYDFIAIVFGGSNYSNIAPSGTYIDAGLYPEPFDLAEYLKYVGSSIARYSSFLQRKAHYKAYLDPWTCHFCEKLHQPLTSSTLSNVTEWWVKNASCRSWEKNKGYYML